MYMGYLHTKSLRVKLLTYTTKKNVHNEAKIHIYSTIVTANCKKKQNKINGNRINLSQYQHYRDFKS